MYLNRMFHKKKKKKNCNTYKHWAYAPAGRGHQYPSRDRDVMMKHFL